jgi:hypothetical protein
MKVFVLYRLDNKRLMFNGIFESEMAVTRHIKKHFGKFTTHFKGTITANKCPNCYNSDSRFKIIEETVHTT